MNFLLDENFPKSADSLLRELGHHVIDSREVLDRGTNDFRLFEAAQEHQAVLLTTDRDFYHTVPIKYAHHHGVIVIALRYPNRQAILARLQWLLTQDLLEEIENTVLLLRDSKYRIRHRP